MKGKAILLNGASSAGKSSISKELQKMMVEPFLIMSVDHFFCASPPYFFKYDPWMYDTDIPFNDSIKIPTDDKDFDTLMASFPKIISGFHRSIKAMLDAGNNLIIDHGFHKLSWYNECRELLKDEDVLYVKITCDKKTLTKREKKRGDRPTGMAVYQESVVHREVDYDYIIDTTELKPKESAKRIKEYVDKLHAT